MMGLVQRQDCYLQKGLLSLLIISRSIQERTEGEKRDLRVCDRNAKKESLYLLNMSDYLTENCIFSTTIY